MAQVAYTLELPAGAKDLSVSVILIVRNGERFIAEALSSVFRSEMKPAEVLVIDDGSTDRTVQLACGFPRTRVVAQRSTDTYDLRPDLRPDVAYTRVCANFIGG